MVTDRHSCEVVAPVLTQVVRVSCPRLKLKIWGLLPFMVQPPKLQYNTFSPYCWIFVKLMDRILFNFFINFRCLCKLNARKCNTIDSWTSVVFCSRLSQFKKQHISTTSHDGDDVEKENYSIVHKTSFKRANKMIWKCHFLLSSSA